MVDRRPALIARPRTVSAVQAGIRLASDHGLALAVRGGGHNVAGTSTCDGGLVLDLGRLNAVHVDSSARVARAQGGTTWGQFDKATGALGLATTGGMISTTGIAGLTLGGGVGWLMRAYGLACDNLLHATVATARDGLVTASPTRHPELFRALRGGGGNFGVVTELAYRLHPVHDVLGGYLLHPIERMHEVLEFYDRFCRTAPDGITTITAVATTPALPPIPPELWNRPSVLVGLCALGAEAEQDQLAAKLRRFGPPAVDLIHRMPYPALQSLLDAGSPPGLRNYWKSAYTKTLTPRLIHALTTHAAQTPSARSQLLIHQMGGAVASAQREETTVSHRQAGYLINIAGAWSDSADDERNIAWVRNLMEQIEPDLVGSYVNYLADTGADEVAAAYDADTQTPLAKAKARWDPGNLFRLNHNITPTPG
ncbi:FAD-binding oxidoreductase [Streptomyces sp. NPDC050161]|uniref:FAD-binding oxidoreductase n=1 Tax=Streptomyces sp. NPDC050161 TaxID=3365604 RepID=UPI0037BCE2BD